MNDATIIIDYGDKTEELNVKQNDILKYNTNLIHTHKNCNNIYVDEYKAAGCSSQIKITCNTNSLKITDFVETNTEYAVWGEDEKWDGIFDG